jgi:hypothetical protein
MKIEETGKVYRRDEVITNKDINKQGNILRSSLHTLRNCGVRKDSDLERIEYNHSRKYLEYVDTKKWSTMQ